MRLSCLFSCALALAWAGAADACCLLKCLKCGGRSAMDAAPIPVRAARDLQIISVGGYQPQNGDVKELIDYKKEVVIVVHGPLPCELDLKLVFDPPVGRPIRVVREQTTDYCVYKFIVEAYTLKPDTKYSVYVTNQGGTSYSDPVTFTTTKP
jgi:hypothetical protein